jgi:hypothetical protein
LRGILGRLGLTLDLVEGRLSSGMDFSELVSDLRATIGAAVRTTHQLSDLARRSLDSSAAVDARYLLTEQQKRLEPKLTGRIALATECRSPELYLLARPSLAYRGLDDLCQEAIQELETGALVIHADAHRESGKDTVRITVASWSAPLDDAFERLDHWIDSLARGEATGTTASAVNRPDPRNRPFFQRHLTFPAHSDSGSRKQ